MCLTIANVTAHSQIFVSRATGGPARYKSPPHLYISLYPKPPSSLALGSSSTCLAQGHSHLRATTTHKYHVPLGRRTASCIYNLAGVWASRHRLYSFSTTALLSVLRAMPPLSYVNIAHVLYVILTSHLLGPRLQGIRCSTFLQALAAQSDQLEGQVIAHMVCGPVPLLVVANFSPTAAPHHSPFFSLS